MNFSEFETKLYERAENLDYVDRIRIGISICKRLYPYYKEFSQESGFGNPDVLLDSISLAESGSQDIDQIHEFLDALEEISPDVDEYDEAEYALDACGAVNALLLQIAEPEDTEHFVEMAMAYYDTIDAIVQDESDEDITEEQIDMHPKMVEARSFLLES